MKSKNLVAALALGIATMSVSPAFAQSRGGDDWGRFLGASIGDSDLGTALKVYAGSSFTNRSFAWEANYIDFGSDNRAGGTVDAWALGGSVIGVLPLNNDFSLFAKLGAHYVKSEFRFGPGRSSDNSVELGVGAGLRWAINPQFALRAEFESIGGEGGEVVSVGLQARF